MSDALSAGLGRLLERGRRGRAFTAAQAFVARDGRKVAEAAVGATARMRFDVASLTKPMVTVTLAMRGVSQGWLDLAAPIADDLPPSITAAALLGHRAGLPAWKDLVAALPPPRHPGSAEARYAVDALVRQAAREADPARGVEYSDLGFILLGRALEERFGRSLAELATVGAYRPLARPRARGFAPTGACPWRGRELVGEVHDPNAWVMGGVAGHAGVFATATEVGRWALALERLANGEGTTDPSVAGIDPDVVRAFWDPARRLGDATWVLGWDSPSATGSSAGTRVGARAVGHLGFTGTSVWIDRDPRLVVVLLTNRVVFGPAGHPRWKAFRPAFHDGVRDLVGLP